MRFSLLNVLSILALILSEAWLLGGYSAKELNYGAAIAFILALSTIFTKDAIKEKIGFDNKKTEHDIRLFKEFQEILPVYPTINLLKNTDFGNSFPKNEIQPLFDFVRSWDSVEKEFINKKLEKKRKILFKDAEDLVEKFAVNTVPIGNHGFVSVFPDNLRDNGIRPPHVIESARILNDASDNFVPKYESFVRICKSVLRS